MTDFSVLCRACVKPAGDSSNQCPNCKIHICYLCGIELLYLQNKYPLECPICGGKLNNEARSPTNMISVACSHN